MEILICFENFKVKKLRFPVSISLRFREVIVLVKGVEVQCTFVGSYTGDGMVQGFLTFWEEGLRESNESSPLSAQKTHTILEVSLQ